MKISMDIKGWISFPRTFGKLHVASLGVPINVNRGAEDEPDWKYLNLSLKSKDVDMEPYAKKRVMVHGELGADAYYSKKSQKDVVSLIVWVNEVEEIEEGDTKKSSVSGKDVKFVKYREYGVIGAEVLIPYEFKTKDGIEKTLFIKCNGNRETLSPIKANPGAKFDFEGFLTADFYGEEQGKPIFFITSVKPAS